MVGGNSVLPFATKRPSTPAAAAPAPAQPPRQPARNPTPAPGAPAQAGSTFDMPEMEIPTFIRRQMD
jgi:hypothetical protein